MWHDYYERDGRQLDDRREEPAVVRREDFDRQTEELGETLVANQVLQAEVEAWKYTSARSLKSLNELVYSLQNGGDNLAKNVARAEALLRELGVYWNTPPGERSDDLDALLRTVPLG